MSLVSEFSNFASDVRAGKQSMSDVAKRLNVTRQYAQSVFKKHFGITGKDYYAGRREMLAPVRAAAISPSGVSVKLENRQRGLYGATVLEMQELFGQKWNVSFNRYCQVRQYNRLHFGEQSWQLTYRDWLLEWSDIGRKKVAGRLCFLRINDQLPFQPGNIRLAPFSEVARALRQKEKLGC